MIGASELFLQIKSEAEAIHAHAFEGQSSDCPEELHPVLVGELCNGLQRLGDLTAQLSCVSRGRA